MAKSKKRTRKPAAAGPQATPQRTRRDMLRLARNGAIGAAVLGVGGFFAARSVQATMYENDLTRVGAGAPTVVQIHDPQCQLCTALQKQARRALKNMGDRAPEYVVANIRTAEGGNFAGRHGVPHVTLLLIDARGRVVETLSGVQDAAVLQSAFERFMGDRRNL
ncbi:MAG: hypothetical protein AAGA12_01050 [Pseudomonadota bacterium]